MTSNDETQRILGRIEERVTNIDRRLSEVILRHDGTIKDHHDRIARLETGRTWLLGAVAATGLFIGVMKEHLLNIIR